MTGIRDPRAAGKSRAGFSEGVARRAEPEGTLGGAPEQCRSWASDAPVTHKGWPQKSPRSFRGTPGIHKTVTSAA